MDATDEAQNALLELIATNKTDLKSVSLAIGRNHSYLQQYIRRGVPRRLPEDVRAALGQYFMVPADTFKIVGKTAVADAPKRSYSGQLPPGATPVHTADLPRNLPVHGTASLGRESGTFRFTGSTADMVRRPPGLEHAPSAFAIYVEGDSMYPAYRAGDLAFINIDRPARAGDDIVIEFTDPSEPDSSVFMLKRLVERSAETLVVEQFSPAKRLEVAMQDVRNTWRVLTPSELMGL